MKYLGKYIIKVFQNISRWDEEKIILQSTKFLLCIVQCIVCNCPVIMDYGEKKRGNLEGLLTRTE